MHRSQRYQLGYRLSQGKSIEGLKPIAIAIRELLGRDDMITQHQGLDVLLLPHSPDLLLDHLPGRLLLLVSEGVGRELSEHARGRLAGTLVANERALSRVARDDRSRRSLGSGGLRVGRGRRQEDVAGVRGDRNGGIDRRRVVVFSKALGLQPLVAARVEDVAVRVRVEHDALFAFVLGQVGMPSLSGQCQSRSCNDHSSLTC
jgi:hypothetical protein